ncbi:MAG TPA: hypothetical protein DEP88_10585 [Verrucomicrobiales bacterium]|mgnify:CR=1 FL=1|jgi:hypothetical protein|nr:hypothetical protein [Verrucomicrobiales bacterium]HCL96290.1 hypothetical protein [Verrucomicrobiales bacterium]
MKTILSLAIIPACLSTPIFGHEGHEDQKTQLGIEAVTSYRSDYVYRGFELAENTLDFQIEGQIAINDYTLLNLGAWYAQESGSSGYDEAAFFTQLRYEKNDQLTLGLSATYRSFSNAKPPLSVAFNDGVDLGVFATWHFSHDLNSTVGAYYDTGADGWYSNLEVEWSRILSDNAFMTVMSGVSHVSDYYGRSGLNDIYGRISLTYHISDSVSITPYLGGSALLDSSDPGSDMAFSGVWFEVRF